jgi:hypothetical protein
VGKEKETASTSRRHLRTIRFITFRGRRTHVVSVVRLCHCQTVRMNDSFKGSVFFFNHSRDIFRSSQIKSSVDEFAIVHFWQRLGLCTHFKFQGVKNNRNHSHSLDLRIHRLYPISMRCGKTNILGLTQEFVKPPLKCRPATDRRPQTERVCKMINIFSSRCSRIFSFLVNESGTEAEIIFAETVTRREKTHHVCGHHGVNR